MPNLPLTLSKVSAGTKKDFVSFALKIFRNVEKFGACRCFNVENCASRQVGISLYILIKNCAKSSPLAFPKSF